MTQNQDTPESEQTCMVCRQPVDSSDESVHKATLEDGSQVFGHHECIEGLRLLLGTKSRGQVYDEMLGGVIRQIEGKPVLVNRNFPNQYLPTLIYFALQEGNPVAMEQFSDWLELNGLKFSNPSMTVSRLVDRGMLAKIASESGVYKYFITSKGERELDAYLSNKNSREE